MAAEALESIPLDPELDMESMFRKLCDMWEKTRVLDGRTVVNPVPLRMVADTFARKVRLLSEPGDEGYEQEIDVAFGRPVDLPEPWGLTLGTAKLTS